MSLTTDSAAKQEFLPLMRELARAYQSFAACDAAGYRESRPSVPQADVKFTLGNTNGLTFKVIGERTLTGVIDRLEQKNLVGRLPGSDERRCIRMTPTARGNRPFERKYRRQIECLKQSSDKLSKSERQSATRLPTKIKELSP